MRDEVPVLHINRILNGVRIGVYMRNRFIPAAACLSVLFLMMTPAIGATITLAWDINSESDLAGYKVYYGQASRSYENIITIGIVNSYTLTGLSPGTYYFTVTAFNTKGLESGFSNEVSAVITDGSGSSKCDCNGDGSVNILDLQILINAFLGISGAVGRDINSDGVIDTLDLQILGEVILGLRSCPL